MKYSSQPFKRKGPMNRQIKADLALLTVTLFWGASYYMMDISLTELEAFNLNALRFLIAFGIAFTLSWTKIKNANAITVKYGAVLGFILVFVYMGATYGVQYTSLSNAGFLCALTVVITPVLEFFFKGYRPDRKLVLVVTMALIGIGLLTLNEQLRPASGDIFCIFCAFAYAIHLIVTETAVHKESVNAYLLGVFQLGFAGLYQLLISVAVETPRLPESKEVWLSVLMLSVFCTGVAFVVQVLAQQYTSASHVGVIFSLEPVFAGVVAFCFAGEVLSGRNYFGAFLLLSSVFLMELDFMRLFHALRKKPGLSKGTAKSSEN